MAENMRFDTKDGLVTLQNSTATSNIAAGTPVALLTGACRIYTIGNDTTGFSCSALMGYHFVGITDADYSAGEHPVTVFTKGVFRLYAAAAGASATNLYVGQAVYASTGRTVGIGRAVTTGDMAIGTVVKIPISASSAWLDVKINPAIWRWSISQIASVTATAHPSLSFPANLV